MKSNNYLRSNKTNQLYKKLKKFLKNNKQSPLKIFSSNPKKKFNIYRILTLFILKLLKFPPTNHINLVAFIQ